MLKQSESVENIYGTKIYVITKHSPKKAVTSEIIIYIYNLQLPALSNISPGICEMKKNSISKLI